MHNSNITRVMMRLHPQLKPKRPLYLWNLLIRDSYTNSLYADALDAYSSMVKSGVHANSYTFPLLIKACGNLNSVRDGSKLQAHVFKLGFHADVFSQTALIDMYSFCSDLKSSEKVFDEMPDRSVVTWNSMVAAYCREFKIEESVVLLKEMMGLGLELCSTVFISMVSACDYWLGLLLHCSVLKMGLFGDTPLSNSMMSMYTRFGCIDSAHRIFSDMEEKSIISWTTMLGAYASAGHVSEVFSLFDQMRLLGIGIDSVVFVNLILGCVEMKNLLVAALVHSCVLKSGLVNEGPINNLLISMYSKCGDIVSAGRVFNMVSETDVFLWTSMIGGYAYLGFPRDALDCFKEMLSTNIRPNEVTIATVLSACADLGSLSLGDEIEDYILLNGLDSDIRVQTALIQMYCKCGSIRKAELAFKRVVKKDLAIWSSMINGYAIHGMAEKALKLFQNMQSEEGIKPDAVVYTSILLACSHSGLVEDGLNCFRQMWEEFRIQPSAEHYSLLVDLLSRAGHFQLAVKTIQDMPISMQSGILGPLLSACRSYRNPEMGEFVAKKLAELEPTSTSNYVLLANLYTSLGKHKEAAATRGSIEDNGLVKEPGWSHID